MALQLTPAEIQQYNQKRPQKVRHSICHAPSRSMYFGMRGEVMVCCTNRSHLAGKYPEKSIKECWTSPEVLKIRAALEKGDMSHGCRVCYDLVRAGNYQNMMGRIYDTIPATPGGYPSRLDFELTNTCNLECVMCRGELSSAIRRNRDKLPPIKSPYDDAFLQQLEEFIPHLSESYFAGGEPFLIGQYLEIWDRMVVMNPNHHLSIQTNATVMSDRVRNLLERMRASIAVSIDSVNPARLSKIRVNADWEVVQENIRYFHDYCKRKGTQLTISFTPMTVNWMELPDSIEYCNAKDIQIFYNSLSYPRQFAFSSLSAEKLKEISTFLHGYNPPANTAAQKANRRSYLDLVNQIDYWQSQAQTAPVTEAPLLKGAAWFSALRTHIESQETPGEAEATYQQVAEKLQNVMDAVAQENHEETLWKHLQTVDFASLMAFVPGKTVPELLAAMRTALRTDEI